MSRIGKKPIIFPSSITVSILPDNHIVIKSSKGQLSYKFDDSLFFEINDNTINIVLKFKNNLSNMYSGTTRSIINNMIIGLTTGFSKKLELIGVGYRAKIVSGKTINLSLGYSHIINYKLPDTIIAETPSPTEIILYSINKELLGEIAADIRSYRIPEVYKGKGIRYSNERILIKEIKKK